MKTKKKIKQKAIKAEFTKFEAGTNWCDGIVGKYNFQAKLFDTGSSLGINDGRVSKLAIWDEKIRKKKMNFEAACVVIYDRGWGTKPNKDVKHYFDAVMKLLENAPKRFE